MLMGVSATYIFSVGLANAIASGYRNSIAQMLLISAGLTGAFMLLLSAILVHFHPAKAYVLAMLALPPLLWVFWPLMSPFIHQKISLPSLLRFYGIRTSLMMGLLVVVTVFTLMRFVRLVRG